MDFSLVDSHAHLDMEHFAQDLEEVITRAREGGVSRIITVGIDLASSRRALALAEKYPSVLAAVGIHPQDSKSAVPGDIKELEILARHPRVVALGEMGLDCYRVFSPKETQVQVLKWQFALAERCGLPVIIHCREARQDLLPLLEEWYAGYRVPEGKFRGVIHCFSGDVETAAKYLELGFFISFGAYIGYPSSAGMRSMIQGIPGDRLIIETDCPFLPPQKYRGQRNESSYVALTAAKLAEIRNVPLETIAQETTRNVRRLFRWPDDS
jgi:TatD DNase family protein